MKVFSFGCSLIFGDELEDTYPSFSRLTWPALWAKEKGFDYDCFAENGLSNWAISRKIIEQTTIHSPDRVIVQWTYNSRIEIKKNDNSFKNLSVWSNIEDARAMIKNSRPSRLRGWPKDKPLEEFEKEELRLEQELVNKANLFESMFARLWFNNISSYSNDLYYSLIWINLASFWLNMKKIPHVFAASDNDLNSVIRTDDALIKSLYTNAHTMSPWIGWKHSKGNGFTPWAQEQGHQFGVSHPLSQAHTAAFNLVRQDLNQILA